MTAGQQIHWRIIPSSGARPASSSAGVAVVATRGVSVAIGAGAGGNFSAGVWSDERC